jgi:hypothetical protein
MNYPAGSGGVSEERDENYPTGVTPPGECFYREGQFRIRLDYRLKHAGMTVLGKGIIFTCKLRGIGPAEIK